MPPKMTKVRYIGGIREVDVYLPTTGNTARVKQGEVVELFPADAVYLVGGYQDTDADGVVTANHPSNPDWEPVQKTTPKKTSSKEGDG